MITASIVIYRNNSSDLYKSIKSTLDNKILKKLYLIDNSEKEIEIPLKEDSRIVYMKNKNKGFGTGHNLALRDAIKNKINYHVIINPDVYYDENVLEELRKKMEEDKEIGLLMPKIYYPNGIYQPLVKLLPTPFDLFQRRFLLRTKFTDRLNRKFEMKFADNNKNIESPYLSGCFMFLRVKVLEEVGLFDEKIFMYSEDLDLTRRIHMKYKTMMYSNVKVYHKWSKGPHKNKKLLYEQIKSSIYYFNKYGWFFDKKRRQINNKILEKYVVKNKEKYV